MSLGEVRPGEVSRGEVRCGVARQDMARQGKALDEQQQRSVRGTSGGEGEAVTDNEMPRHATYTNSRGEWIDNGDTDTPCSYPHSEACPRCGFHQPKKAKAVPATEKVVR